MKGKDSKLSKEFILNSIAPDELSSQIAIFEKYLGISNIYNIVLNNEMIVNTLRPDDFPTCTFKLYKNKDSYKLWFRDWGETRGLDCFDLVQKLANCSFTESLELIAYHFGLLSAQEERKFKYVMTPAQIIEISKKQNKPIQLRVKTTKWTKEHIDYWRQYGLDAEDVTYDTAPIEYYWYNDTKFKVNKIGFVYFFSDNYDYKIYLPFANKAKGEPRFMHNRADIVQGHNQLKYDKSVLLITSSNKDVKVLRKLAKLHDFDYEAVAPMSETTPIPKDIIDFYKTKYSMIILYYNNDKQGVVSSEAHSKLYDCVYIVNPPDYPKDPSDVRKQYGESETVELIKSLLYHVIAPF
jgi:hypothetical protein